MKLFHLLGKLFAGNTPVKTSQRTTKLHLEPLEDRIVPATGDYYWDPQVGAGTNFNVDQQNAAGMYQNWDLNTFGSDIHPANLPTAGTNVIFDGADNNGKCNVDVPLQGRVQLEVGYTGLFTIGATASLTLNAFNDASPSTDKFNVNFAGVNSLLVAAGAGGEEFYNFDFEGLGEFLVNSGTVYLGPTSGLSCKATCNMVIQGGTVNIGPIVASPSTGYSTVHWQSFISVGTATAGGTLNFVEDTVTAGTLLSNDNQVGAGQDISVFNNSTVNFQNPGNSNLQMTIDMGTETVSQTAVINATQGGSWKFTRAIPGTADRDVELVFDGSTLNLAKNAILEFKDRLFCDPGTVANPKVIVTDNSAPTLQTDGANPSVLQDVKFLPVGGFATLQYAGKMQIAGTAYFNVDADLGASDTLQPLANATLDISTGTVDVRADGGVKGTTFWILIGGAQGATITANAQTGDWAHNANIPLQTKIIDTFMPEKWGLQGTAPFNMSAAGFSGGVAGGLAILNGNFDLVYNSTNDDWESTQQSNGHCIWTLYYDGTTWELLGTDYFANYVTYALSGTFNPEGNNTFDFVSSSGGGTCPSTLTITLA